MKTCTKCGLEKSLAEFSIRKISRDGFRHHCKSCMSAKGRAWVAANLDRERARRRKRYAEDPERFREKSRRWRIANPETQTEIARRWRENHPDVWRERAARQRARKHEAFVEKVVRSDIFARDEGICHLCDKAVDPDKWDLDHVVPLSRGGDHSPSNVRVSHPSCNRSRGNKLLPVLA